MLTKFVQKAISIGIFMLVAAVLSALVGLIMAFPVMLLWNWVVPGISGNILGSINYLHAWALFTLMGILFSSGKTGVSNGD